MKNTQNTPLNQAIANFEAALAEAKAQNSVSLAEIACQALEEQLAACREA